MVFLLLMHRPDSSLRRPSARCSAALACALCLAAVGAAPVSSAQLASADTVRTAGPPSAGVMLDGADWTRSGAEAVTTADSTAELRERPLPITAFGYYRLFLYGRDFGNPYANLEPFERVYGVGDGYREPALSLNILGRPNGRSAFGTELFVYSGYEGIESQADIVTLNLGVNFYGNFRTEIGNYGVRAGGIHWYNLSPFTIGVYQVLDRFSIFERTPWEGVDGIDKYERYYRTGQANPGDARWNFQAFQGLILDGRQLPGGINFDAFWGKTQPNGGLPNAELTPGDTQPGDSPIYVGLSGEARALPSVIAGGRLEKTFGTEHAIAANSITSYRTLDSLSGDRRQYQVHTAQFTTRAAGLELSGELGASLYENPTYTSPWGEALMMRAKTGAETTRLPLDVQVYQIGRHFFNENGEIATNNNPQIRADPGCAVPAGGGSVGGAITQVNQLAHNRRGINVNTGVGLGPAQLAVGWGLAHELAATTNELSYVHRINGLALSRVYNPFPAEAVCATQFGPLGRKFSFFRGTFERVQLTDVEPVTGLAQNRKYYHAVDLQGKVGFDVLDRGLYFFYLGSFGSANTSAQLLPRDDDTYLFVQYHELDTYFEVLPSFVLTGYLGLENARGGRFTELGYDENGQLGAGKPRDQLGRGIGLGFDWTIARNAGLFLRHRWFDFEDRSFTRFERDASGEFVLDENEQKVKIGDFYSGTETTLELKIFF